MLKGLAKAYFHFDLVIELLLSRSRDGFDHEVGGVVGMLTRGCRSEPIKHGAQYYNSLSPTHMQF